MSALPDLLPALITPFDDSGEVDLDSHRFNLQTLKGQGITGFLIAGSTGEGPYLDPGERQALVEASRNELRDTYLLCGIAAETVRQAKSMISEAANGGADAALVITPTTLTRTRVQYVKSFYLELAESSPIPILLYSVPAVTAFELPEDLVERLSQHPNIVGLKDSGGHPVRVQRLVANTEPGFSIFNGSTQAVTLAITAGAYGAITASTNYLPRALLNLVATALTDPISAREEQRRIGRISAAVEAHGIPGVKAAAAAGLRAGYPRAPLAAVDEMEAGRLAALVG